MKIAICSLVWQRPEIFEMFAKGIHALSHPDVQIKVFIAGSEGEKSRKMVEAQGFSYIEIANSPLAAKANAPIRLAKEWGADYVLCTGSDDIMSIELFNMYVEITKQQPDFVGVTDYYFYDTTTRTATYWGGYREEYRKGRTCGAFRMLSKRVLKEWNWKVFENNHSAVLDNSMDQKLRVMDHKSCTFSMKKYGVLAIDVKSSVNMTPYELWDNTKKIDPKILTDKFPYICAE